MKRLVSLVLLQTLLGACAASTTLRHPQTQAEVTCDTGGATRQAIAGSVEILLGLMGVFLGGGPADEYFACLKTYRQQGYVEVP